MFYVHSKLRRSEDGTVSRLFHEGPFQTHAQARTCARINARKLGTTLTIVHDPDGPCPELDRAIAEELAA